MIFIDKNQDNMLILFTLKRRFVNNNSYLVF